MANSQQLRDLLMELSGKGARELAQQGAEQVTQQPSADLLEMQKVANQQQAMSSVESQIANTSNKMEQVGVDPTQFSDLRNPVEKALNLPQDQNWLFDIFTVLQRPQQAIFKAISASQTGKDVGSEFMGGLTGTSETIYGKELLTNAGAGDNIITDILGFGLDIFADPADIAFIPASAVMKGTKAASKLTSTGLDVVTKGASKIDDIYDASKKIIQGVDKFDNVKDNVEYIKKGVDKLGDFIQGTGAEALTPDNLAKAKKAKRNLNTAAASTAGNKVRESIPKFSDNLKKALDSLDIKDQEAIYNKFGKNFNLVKDSEKFVSPTDIVMRSLWGGAKTTLGLTDEVLQFGTTMFGVGDHYGTIKKYITNTFSPHSLYVEAIGKTKGAFGGKAVWGEIAAKTFKLIDDDIAKFADANGLDPEAVQRMVSVDYVKQGLAKKGNKMRNAQSVSNILNGETVFPHTDEIYQKLSDAIRLEVGENIKDILPVVTYKIDGVESNWISLRNLEKSRIDTGSNAMRKMINTPDLVPPEIAAQIEAMKQLKGFDQFSKKVYGRIDDFYETSATMLGTDIGLNGKMSGYLRNVISDSFWREEIIGAAEKSVGNKRAFTARDAFIGDANVFKSRKYPASSVEANIWATAETLDKQIYNSKDYLKKHTVLQGGDVAINSALSGSTLPKTDDVKYALTGLLNDMLGEDMKTYLRMMEQNIEVKVQGRFVPLEKYSSFSIKGKDGIVRNGTKLKDILSPEDFNTVYDFAKAEPEKALKLLGEDGIAQLDKPMKVKTVSEPLDVLQKTSAETASPITDITKKASTVTPKGKETLAKHDNAVKQAAKAIEEKSGMSMSDINKAYTRGQITDPELVKMIEDRQTLINGRLDEAKRITRAGMSDVEISDEYKRLNKAFNDISKELEADSGMSIKELNKAINADEITDQAILDKYEQRKALSEQRSVFSPESTDTTRISKGEQKKIDAYREEVRATKKIMRDTAGVSGKEEIKKLRAAVKSGEVTDIATVKAVKDYEKAIADERAYLKANDIVRPKESTKTTDLAIKSKKVKSMRSPKDDLSLTIKLPEMSVEDKISTGLAYDEVKQVDNGLIDTKKKLLALKDASGTPYYEGNDFKNFHTPINEGMVTKTDKAMLSKAGTPERAFEDLNNQYIELYEQRADLLKQYGVKTTSELPKVTKEDLQARATRLLEQADEVSKTPEMDAINEQRMAINEQISAKQKTIREKLNTPDGEKWTTTSRKIQASTDRELKAELDEIKTLAKQRTELNTQAKALKPAKEIKPFTPKTTKQVAGMGNKRLEKYVKEEMTARSNNVGKLNESIKELESKIEILVKDSIEYEEAGSIKKFLNRIDRDYYPANQGLRGELAPIDKDVKTLIEQYDELNNLKLNMKVRNNAEALQGRIRRNGEFINPKKDAAKQRKFSSIDEIPPVGDSWKYETLMNDINMRKEDLAKRMNITKDVDETLKLFDNEYLTKSNLDKIRKYKNLVKKSKGALAKTNKANQYMVELKELKTFLLKDLHVKNTTELNKIIDAMPDKIDKNLFDDVKKLAQDLNNPELAKYKEASGVLPEVVNRFKSKAERTIKNPFKYGAESADTALLLDTKVYQTNLSGKVYKSQISYADLFKEEKAISMEEALTLANGDKELGQQYYNVFLRNSEGAVEKQLSKTDLQNADVFDVLQQKEKGKLISKTFTKLTPEEAHLLSVFTDVAGASIFPKAGVKLSKYNAAIDKFSYIRKAFPDLQFEEYLRIADDIGIDKPNPNIDKIVTDYVTNKYTNPEKLYDYVTFFSAKQTTAAKVVGDLNKTLNKGVDVEELVRAAGRGTPLQILEGASKGTVTGRKLARIAPAKGKIGTTAIDALKPKKVTKPRATEVTGVPRKQLTDEAGRKIPVTAPQGEMPKMLKGQSTAEDILSRLERKQLDRSTSFKDLDTKVLNNTEYDDFVESLYENGVNEKDVGRLTYTNVNDFLEKAQKSLFEDMSKKQDTTVEYLSNFTNRKVFEESFAKQFPDWIREFGREITNAKVYNEVFDTMAKASRMSGDTIDFDDENSLIRFVPSEPKEVERAKGTGVFHEMLMPAKDPIGYRSISNPQQLANKMRFANNLLDSKKVSPALNDVAKQIEELNEAIKAGEKHGRIVMEANAARLISLDLDKGSKELTKLANMANDLFKRNKLLSPAFNIRNVIGVTTNMWLSGMSASDIGRFFGEADRVFKQADDLMLKRASMNDRMWTKYLRTNPNEAKAWNALETYMRGQFKIPKHFKEVLKEGLEGTGSEMMDITESAFREGGQLVTPQNQNIINRISLANGWGNETIDAYGRMAVMLKAMDGDAGRKYLENLNLASDDYIGAVRLSMFDPKNLTANEQEVLKKIIPFYTFTKMNLAYHMSNIPNNAVRYHRMYKAVDASWNLMGINKEDVDDYKLEQMYIPLPGINEDGKYYAIKANFPQSDVAEFISNPLSKGLAMVTPLARAPFEWATGTSIFTGNKIENFKGERSASLPFLSKKTEYLLSQTGADVPMRSGYGLVKAATGDVVEGVGQFTNMLSQGNTTSTALGNQYNTLENLQAGVSQLKQQGVILPEITVQAKQNQDPKLAQINVQLDMLLSRLRR